MIKGPYAKIRVLVNDLDEFNPTRIELYKTIADARRYKNVTKRWRFYAIGLTFLGFYFGLSVATSMC